MKNVRDRMSVKMVIVHNHEKIVKMQRKMFFIKFSKGYGDVSYFLLESNPVVMNQFNE